MLEKESILHLCQTVGTMEKIDPRLLAAICEVESNFDQYAVRPEKAWMYWYPCNPEREENKFKLYCRNLGVWYEAEHYNQRQSWGLCQIMGSVARELGYTGKYLPGLCDPTQNLSLACKLLNRLYERYKNWEDVKSAYNQGGNYKGDDGKYRNYQYVNKVNKAMEIIEF